MNPRLEVFSSPRDVACSGAELLAARLRRRGRHTFLLATGKTMVPLYRELTRLHSAGRAPFNRAETFNLDELRVAGQDPRSFRSFMNRHLFSKIRLPPEQTHFLNGDAADSIAECRRYERQLALLGPPDFALVGIGENGHVAYLEPGKSLPPRTSLVRLSASTRRGLAANGVRPVPREALTMGIETILSARELLLVATGREKAVAVSEALEGRVNARCPASLLSLHPRLTVLLDRAAAAGLSR